MYPSDGSTFLSHDLHLLESVEFKQRIKLIVEIIDEVNWQDVDPDTLTRFLGHSSFLWWSFFILFYYYIFF